MDMLYLLTPVGLDIQLFRGRGCYPGSCLVLSEFGLIWATYIVTYFKFIVWSVEFVVPYHCLLAVQGHYKMTTSVGSGNVYNEPGKPSPLSVVAVAPMMGLVPVELE